MRIVKICSDLVRRLNMTVRINKIIKKADVKVFGEEYTLPVKYDVFVGEKLLDSQKDALERFLGKADSLLADSDKIKSYIEHTKHVAVNDLTNKLEPTCIYVERNDKDRYTAVLLSPLDDNGKKTGESFAIEFKNEEFFRIGDRSIVV